MEERRKKREEEEILQEQGEIASLPCEHTY
jgi:hypothetical protein